MAETAIASDSSIAAGPAQRPKRAKQGKSGALDAPLAVRLVEAAYVVLLGFLFVSLIFTILTPARSPNPPPVRAMVTTPPDVTIFSRFDPFIGNAPAPTPVQDYADVEETRLDLKLVGTFLSEDAPSATIELSSGRQQVFFIGDEVTSGAEVQDIVHDQVILSRAGVSETLSLEGRQVEDSGVARQRARAAATGPADSSEAVNSDDPLSAYIQLSPHETGRGYVVRPGSNPALFEAAGLLAGDQVLEANGRPLPSRPTLAAGSMMRLISRGPVELTVVRGGVPLTLTIDPSGLTL